MNQDRVGLREPKTTLDPDRHFAVGAHVTEIAAPLGERHAQVDLSIFVSDAEQTQRQLHLVGMTRLSASVQNWPRHVAEGLGSQVFRTAFIASRWVCAAAPGDSSEPRAALVCVAPLR